MAAISIRPAVWPQDAAAAESLLRHYAASLAVEGGSANIRIENYEEELATLAETWSLPRGVLLLALDGGQPAGCVAIKVRSDLQAASEMKRLWVEPAHRGLRLGRQLAQAAIAWSRDHGSAVLLLDTVPAAMPEAGALYRSLGFVETERHNSNPVPGLQFLKLFLR